MQVILYDIIDIKQVHCTQIEEGLMQGEALREIQIETPSWVIKFISRLEEQGLSKSTLRGYEYDLKIFCQWTNQVRGTDAIEDVSSGDVRAYRHHLVEIKKFKGTTANRRLLALKKALVWAGNTGLNNDSAPQTIRLVRQGSKKQPKALNAKEINSLLRAASTSKEGFGKRNYALVQIMLQAGLRVSEVANAVMGDVILRERSGQIHIRDGKGHRERYVPLNASIRRALSEYFGIRDNKKNNAPLFESNRGEKMSIRSVQHAVFEMARRAKIDRLPATCHSLRHTFALNFLQSNQGKIVELANLLGHDSLDTTSIYTQPSEEKLLHDIEKSSLNVYG